jgi:hypothetical protein
VKNLENGQELEHETIIGTLGSIHKFKVSPTRLGGITKVTLWSLSNSPHMQESDCKGFLTNLCLNPLDVLKQQQTIREIFNMCIQPKIKRNNVV